MDANRVRETTLRRFAADTGFGRTAANAAESQLAGAAATDGRPSRRRKEQTMTIPIPCQVRQLLDAGHTIEAG
jgi:hypothetical protein